MLLGPKKGFLSDTGENLRIPRLRGKNCIRPPSLSKCTSPATSEASPTVITVVLLLSHKNYESTVILEKTTVKMESSENEFFGISINEYAMYIIHFTGFSLLHDKLLVL